MADPAARFVHLHVHSHFSLLSSTIRLDALCRKAAATGAGAVALTDDANLFGAVEFCQAAAAAGIRPIVGCDLHVARGSRREHADGGAKDGKPWRLVVLVEDEAGYRSLVRLVSAAYLEGLGKKPCVDRELLEKHHAGLIALSGGLDGEVGAAFAAGRPDEAQRAAERLRDAFGAGRFFLELQDTGRPGQRELNAFSVELAARIGVDVTATNDCRFLEPDGHEAQRALECIGAGSTLDDPVGAETTPEQYFRTPEEMARLFSHVPRALATTVEIAERCTFRIQPAKEPLLPDFSVAPGQTIESTLRGVARAGLAERRRAGQAAKDAVPFEEYESRLEKELDVICGMGFPGYFLIVWDVIRHAREQGIPVGPGRGSAAGSLVAFALRITDLDPLEWGLLFERFLNPGRKSLPDIDMDFCQRRRGEVLRYVQSRYGEDRVAQIITFGSLKARSVVRDVGRVMNMTFGEVDRIAKLVTDELGATLEKALVESPQLAELARTDARVGRLMDTARALEGLARNAGVHAAGVVIAPKPLAELVPLFKTGRNEVTTQFAMGGAETIGLVKMDFLGLKTLTVVDDAVKSIERAEGLHIRLEELPLDDPKTYALFQQARTSGIFQFESSGMRDVLRRLGPETLEDLIALNALYRPGPMQFIDSFIARRRGKERVAHPHPLLEKVLAPTYGIMVYQEQVMQASRELAGFTQAEADDLRKAMGKKKPEVMAAQKSKFVEGAIGHGVKQDAAAAIFDAIERFAGYAFNRAHSACYALVAYWTAWLKANHPAHFMAALLTSEGDHTDKVVRYIAECKDMGLEVLPPDVNESDVDFTAVSRQAVRFGLSAIKGVGRSAVASILEARAAAGRFTSLEHFCREIDLRLNNRKVLEALIKAGALDSLGSGRSQLMAEIEGACALAQAARADRDQHSLFGDEGQGPALRPEPPRVPEWTERDRLSHEKEVLGFYVSGHPLREHAAILQTLRTTSTATLAEHEGREVLVAGIVTALRRTRTKKGDWMAFLTLEDVAGQVEVIAFPEAWRTSQDFVEADAVLCVKGTVELDGERGKILAASLTPLRRAEEAAAAALRVRLPEGLAAPRLDETLRRTSEILAAQPGNCPVRFEIVLPDVGVVTIQAGAQHRVRPEPAVVASLEQVVGPGRVTLTFD